MDQAKLKSLTVLELKTELTNRSLETTGKKVRCLVSYRSGLILHTTPSSQPFCPPLTSLGCVSNLPA